MTQLNEIPSTGKTFDWLGYTFEVMDMDGRRVDKVLITPLQQKGPQIEETTARDGEER
jgi:putative hemolysin